MSKRPRGRPSRGYKKNGDRDKRVKWGAEAVDEAGIRLATLTTMDGIDKCEDKVLAFLKRRFGEKYRLRDHWHVPQRAEIVAAKFPEQWLRENIFSIGDDKPSSVPRGMPMSRNLVCHGNHGCRKVHEEKQLLHWVGLVRDTRLALTFENTRGLGVTSIRGCKFKNQECVLQGYHEHDFTCTNYVTAGTAGTLGTTFGPLSLINSGCSAHANVKFNTTFSKLIVTKPRALEEGNELLANYTQGGGLVCAFKGCTTKVRGPR